MPNPDRTAPKNASAATARANRDAVGVYDMADRQDFEDADRGFIAGLPDGRVLGVDGHVVFDLDRFAYLTDDAPAPDTVNPSLWRQVPGDSPGRPVQGRRRSGPGAEQ